MRSHIAQGWRLASRHMHLVLLLFLYQLLWGVVLYRLIDSTVAPLLRRFPGTPSSQHALQPFMTEAQFHLFKTELITPYLWVIGGLFAARMLITPLFNAGLYYSLHHEMRDGGGTRFLEGIRRAWKPVMLLYWLESALVLAPAYWLLPKGLELVLHSTSLADLATGILLGAACWLLWAGLLQLLFLAMQLGAVTGDGIFRTLGRAVSRFLSYASLSLLMWGIGLLLGMAISGLSVWIAGLIALILHQSFPLLRTLIKVWTVASQYNCLQSK
ncbi:hypothetical protein M6D81_18690 [Paenibacillus sp. J5C_2022]|uniref:hypothetical protein n=1 Tax=Paenibacillus sp. J5C2022 TaxID=2977129 RepID=UPI0021CEFB75|nr:hypothetical protein [Paenibacillus sp. J5C2022]MCU6710722.1 hypothetical protein [Paenibacillus sp. J5C2022]